MTEQRSKETDLAWNEYDREEQAAALGLCPHGVLPDDFCPDCEESWRAAWE